MYWVKNQSHKLYLLQVYNLSQNIQEDDLQHLQVRLFNEFN